jgi:hypothetical protein
MDDQHAIERYRYMLRTAPPDDVERAHAEAFARLTPEQRALVLRELSRQVPVAEVAGSDDPQSLARMATRAEMRAPGTMERTFSQVGAGPGLGGIFLSTIAGAFIGTAIADAFFAEQAGDTGAAGGDQTHGDTGEYANAGDAGDVGTDGDLVGDVGGDFGGDIGF